MIRIEQTDKGLYVVYASGVSCYDDNDGAALPEPIREKFLLLRASDEGTFIPGVGRRLSGGIYWISEDGSDTLATFNHTALYRRDLAHHIIANK